ncbi:hypothetical protein SODALDRAFT_331697 [Sodiomyces alkalinus F11]|uniref:Uncharacterized protein n=1 Tax=Sodiomyces alkalinus (strain CBS 110278 / VKM F-3762 / F11) TaxID=1314773 RepID=A0A3N2PYT5_SODAK|nr:hypothetical protein SODALDRAFT_331697 [Sodiomyces alkalinus F11]ROT39586.1 hypothetical protein SODALDRAFT_331697 [Sodiomyces alkalinus F11]
MGHGESIGDLTKLHRTQRARNNNRVHRTSAYYFPLSLGFYSSTIRLTSLQTIVASMWMAVLGCWTVKAPILILFIGILGVFAFFISLAGRGRIEPLTPRLSLASKKPRMTFRMACTGRMPRMREVMKAWMVDSGG